MLSFPGIEVAPKPDPPAGGEGDDAEPEEPVDDGFTPEQRRKNELENDPGFKAYLMMKKMRIPLINIRKRMKMENKGYSFKDMDLFADKEEIETANTCPI